MKLEMVDKIEFGLDLELIPAQNTSQRTNQSAMRKMS
jgi:hypothetical protein